MSAVLAEDIVTIVGDIGTLLDRRSVANDRTNVIQKVIHLNSKGKNCLHIEVDHVGNFLELPRRDGSGRGNRAEVFAQAIVAAFYTDGELVKRGKGDRHLWMTIMCMADDFNFFYNKKGDPPGIFFVFIGTFIFS